MSADISTIGTDALDELLAHLGALKDNSESVEEFSRWFLINSRWEARSSSDTLVDLGLDIESILYQWQAYPDVVTASVIVRAIEDSLDAAGLVHEARRLTTSISTATFDVIDLPPRQRLDVVLQSVKRALPRLGGSGQLVGQSRIGPSHVHTR